MISVTNSQKRALIIATAAAVVVGVYFLKYYLMLIVFAAIVAFIFNPFYQRLLKRGSSPAKAASLTLIASFFALIIPIMLITAITVYQVTDLADDVSQISQNTDLHKIAVDTIDSVNRLLGSIGISYQLQLSTITDALSSSIKSFGSSLASGLLSSISGIAAFITIAIIYMYVLCRFLNTRHHL